MIDWKIILIGSGLGVILGFILSFIPFGTSTVFFLSSVYVGYMVGGENRSGVDHGAIVGVIEGIVTVIIVRFVTGYQVLAGTGIDLFVIVLSAEIISGIIFGAIGGAIGSFIKKSRSSKGSTV
jgi:hypothetical protein